MKPTIRNFEYGPELYEDLENLEQQLDAALVKYSWSSLNMVHLEFCAGGSVDVTPICFIQPDLSELFNSIHSVEFSYSDAHVCYSEFKSIYEIDSMVKEYNADEWHFELSYQYMIDYDGDPRVTYTLKVKS
jgi:hypothetical protein